jgi:hypothetical protein
MRNRNQVLAAGLFCLPFTPTLIPFQGAQANEQVIELK